MVMLTKDYFTHKEIYKKCTSTEIQIALLDKTIQHNIYEMVNILNSIRHYLDTPIIINSWYRGVIHNQIVKGAKDSHHLKGGAVDIRCIPDKMPLLRQLCYWCPRFTQIIYYDSFIHVSIIPTKNKRFYDKRTNQ